MRVKNTAAAIPREDLSYNLYLFQKRKEARLRLRKFAKLLKIRPFRYRLIENGYIRPSKEDVKKISDYFGEDFNYYLEGIRNYPSELNNKKSSAIAEYMYHMFTKLAVRLTFLIIAILSIAAFVVTLLVFPQYDFANVRLYDDNMVELHDRLLTDGDKSFSLFNFSYPKVSENYDTSYGEKAVIIKSTTYAEESFSLKFSEIHWSDKYRVVINYDGKQGDIVLWRAYVFDYETYESLSYDFYEVGGTFMIEERAGSAFVKEIVAENDIHADFTALIRSKLGVDVTFDETIDSIAATQEKYSGVTIGLFIALLFELLLIFGFVFLFFYATIYRKELGESLEFSHSDELLDLKPLYKPIKRDIRFTPFIPETLLRVIAILLIFFGAIRAIMYTLVIGSYSSENLELANTFYSMQLTGLFLIFFLNFDVFMDDERVFRNLILYPMVFFLIYVGEALLVMMLTETESILSFTLGDYVFPNPFGAAACYFLIMAFLFFTPKYIKTKKGLIVYRAMAGLPILFLIISFMLGNTETLFGWKIENPWVQYLFKGDRFTLSVLAIVYLVSLFFVRLGIKKKYGEKNAEKIFMGNRYILVKNAIAAVLFVLIWAFEMAVSKNDTFTKLGIGQNYYLILLAPFVMLYHPHKNARNVPVDILTISFYVIGLVILYASSVIVALFSLVS